MSQEAPEERASGATYLVMYRGAARMEVYPLQFGQRITIGRSETCNVVVIDPKCSRQHCELYPVGRNWKLRDLGSRNGVTVNGQRVRDDWPMKFGQKIELGEVTLLFTDQVEESEAAPLMRVEGTDLVVTDRRSGTLFDRPPGVGSPAPVVTTKPFFDLIQISREMTSADSAEKLVQLVLNRLVELIPAACGAVLLFPPNTASRAAESLVQAAVHRQKGYAGETFSDALSKEVLGLGQALLAQDVRDLTSLARQESVQQMRALSAICAPIRSRQEILGLIHLYGTRASEPLTPDHLEFVLGAADQLGTQLQVVRRQETLISEKHQLESERSELRAQLEIDTELVGGSETLGRVKRSIGRVAATDATVLVRGESGVGKELVARAIHFNSARKNGPFVCVNCAALTETLLESELFGHEKGSFTGAVARKAGKFEQAHQGTLFLDEVGEMNPEIQSKFLRVLEAQTFERIGGAETIHVDVRVVTATNKDLEVAVSEGKFRQDLFYRLQVIELQVPPLREHPEDIPRIAQHFLERFSRRSSLKAQGFNSAALQVLQAHPWPGNVRELRNVVERAVILSDKSVLGPDDIQLGRPIPVAAETTHEPPSRPAGITTVDIRVPVATSVPGHDTVLTEAGLWQALIEQGLSLDAIDRMYIEAVLNRFNWNKSQASRLLGIERTTLDRRLKKYDMYRPDGSEGSDE